MSERISRRRLLKLGASAGAVIFGSAALGKAGVSAIEALGEAAERQNQLPDHLLKPTTDTNLKELDHAWRTLYQVRGGDTIDGIAARFYPDFYQNLPVYRDKLRFANGQDKAKNTLIYPGQALFVPDPRIPTLGFAAGEQAVLRGNKIEGKYWPTKINKINIKNKKIEISYYDGTWEEPLTVGHEFATDRGFRIAAVLEGISGLVPPRVVLELFQ